ncbi:MAG: hypothetical protein B0D96_01655 [Candidatus Sedimenticola endophacoides]|uniref:HD/PDEase domain-containing protein n=1 Tax=Candidatus Sedimenticola endophacoides TaxID=2548426 RepID=A0A657PZY2_9GAMM|nr:MAG: hypothetical protein B0D94_12495 [Candidatus Sedimenticola endophacoides]OQX37659.1 MAG: hypothetical protein B0D96_01655 [Candidatus Sedimenticola endophacoides]OQX39083.1 MAG: hypothetical protein B0D89_11490 [Candidatus Sedimenticola endophacoides]OQX44995.1 MAG: hypothetical protein B0D88_01300 [Candidatus Sedimenticola endophacoides]OQX45634.1 MAG: hypothetical protein B0D85_05345 [Candidatus Sedimenticola endophacoides]
MIDKARRFAIQAHGAQRYGPHPYVHHLDAVARHAEPFGETAQVIAYLHDVVEDTAVDLHQITEQFGEFVSRCVEVVTDEEGASRRERKDKTYRKMGQVEDERVVALVVKTADRLANIQSCRSAGMERKLAMYRAEHGRFREAVYRPGLCEALWLRLEAALDDGF